MPRDELQKRRQAQKAAGLKRLVDECAMYKAALDALLTALNAGGAVCNSAELTKLISAAVGKIVDLQVDAQFTTDKLKIEFEKMSPEERATFVSEFFAGYYRWCWRKLGPVEVCHCENDE